MVWTAARLGLSVAASSRRSCWLISEEHGAHSITRAMCIVWLGRISRSRWVLAKRDAVVLPELSESLLRNLENTGGRPQILKENCGHYSLGRVPYILSAVFCSKRFLS